VAAFAAIYVFHVPFPWIVLVAALAGAAGGRLMPHAFAIGAHAEARTSYGPAIIDDDTPTPEHARYRPARLAALIAVSLAIWGLAILAVRGWDGTLGDMAGFFTKAALLTFGGGYAVLPYVYQAAVEQHQWLTGPQMIDGLALGETTPGPLIMVVAFVGFVGGWTHQLFGADAAFAAGVAGASVATFFTFLPSFVFIFVGGPLVESTHGDLRFTAPLSGITAAVVGVIVSLAAFFAGHVFFTGGIDGVAMAIAAAALVALVRYKAGLIPVIVCAGAVGMVFKLVS
jgi:chromate transporter